MALGSFYKGEKKKKKKGQGSVVNFAPVFVPPSVIKKGKDKF